MAIDTILNDGTPICIRPVTAADEDRLRSGIAKLSKRSRYLRFFSGMETPPQGVIDALLDIDGHDHIAWGALRSDLAEKPALGIVHAFRDGDDPHSAQYSVAVIDEYHGRGLARLLTAVLLLDCRSEGLEELHVHILSENASALSLTRSLGGRHLSFEGNVSEYRIHIEAAIRSLAQQDDLPGFGAIIDQYPHLSDEERLALLQSDE